MPEGKCKNLSTAYIFHIQTVENTDMVHCTTRLDTQKNVYNEFYTFSTFDETMSHD
jgi:hypothetical protein